MLIRFFFCGFLLLGCASNQSKLGHDLELSSYKKIKWSEINLSNAKDKIGTPDISEAVGNNQNEIVWIYLGGTPLSSRLTLLFNKVDGHILNATWFFRSYDKKADTKYLAKKYQFDLTQPRENPQFFGVRKDYYTNPSKSMEMTVVKKDNFVESISWIVGR